MSGKKCGIIIMTDRQGSVTLKDALRCTAGRLEVQKRALETAVLKEKKEDFQSSFDTWLTGSGKAPAWHV